MLRIGTRGGAPPQGDRPFRAQCCRFAWSVSDVVVRRAAQENLAAEGIGEGRQPLGRYRQVLAGSSLIIAQMILAPLAWPYLVSTPLSNARHFAWLS